MKRPPDLVAIDLCCGAGGWACAARNLPIRISLAVDSWDVCCRTYGMNHLGTQVLQGDLREPGMQQSILDACAGDIDLVLGGIPCQWLSVRRNIGGANAVSAAERDSERRTLQAALDLIATLNPAYWCLEDVKGIVRELPESVPWVEIDSAFYSAQRRKRIYVGRFPPPIFAPCDLKLRNKLRPGPFRIGRRAAERSIVRSQAFAPDRVCGAWPHRKGPTVCAWGSRRDAELVVVDKRLASGRRQLEWQEGAALQGFPDDYVFYGSPTDVWKMVGQAIQIDTGAAILRAIVQDHSGAD